tara:strand:- start:301 stop:525 length:225 start_codon:yes stop_codon:yes gene_type:complete
VTGLIILGIVLLFITGILWGANMGRKAQTAKSIGDLLNEEIEANDRLQQHVEVLRDSPVDGANRRLHDKWTRPE